MTTPLDLDNVPGHAAMERAALDGFLAGIALRQPQAQDAVGSVLGQDPAELNGRVLQLAELALGLLPVGALQPLQKAVYGRQNHSMLSTLAVNIVEALRMLAPLHISSIVAPERLETLLRQKGAFETFKLLGMQMTNSAMDQRLLLGSFLGFLIDRTLDALSRRWKSEMTSNEERDRLLDDFAPALLLLDEVLRYPAERRQELSARRKDMESEVKEAQADAALAETSLKLRQNLLVPREELLAAARRHVEKSGTPGGPGQPAGTPLPPPTGPRRIV